MTSNQGSETRSYLDAVSLAISGVDEARIEEIAVLLTETAREGRLILIGGNGGSFATALHLATDLEKCVSAAVPLSLRGSSAVPRVKVLGENPCVWTAWANDVSWDTALAHQVTAWGRSGDVLLLLSASGASKNLVAAAAVAKAKGLTVVALVGKAVSELGLMADVPLVIGTDDVQQAEDCHMACCHAIFREVLRKVKDRVG